MELSAQYATNTEGIGNIYKLWGSWKSVFCVLVNGWEKCYNHPAQLHYALDYKDRDLDLCISKTAFEALEELRSDIDLKVVLDAGCGVGGASFQLASTFPNIKFIGITAVEEQAQTATKRAQFNKITNLSYFGRNYLSTGLDKESVDGIFALETFVYVSNQDKPKLFAELFRILKPGAKVVIFDGYLSTNDRTKLASSSSHKKIAEGWAIAESISTASEIVGFAETAGFKSLIVQDITARILGSAKEIWFRSIIFYIPIKLFIILAKLGLEFKFTKELGFDKTESQMFQYTCYSQYKLFKNGETQYYKIVLQKPHSH